MRTIKTFIIVYHSVLISCILTGQLCFTSRLCTWNEIISCVLPFMLVPLSWELELLCTVMTQISALEVRGLMLVISIMRIIHFKAYLQKEKFPYNLAHSISVSYQLFYASQHHIWIPSCIHHWSHVFSPKLNLYSPL